MDSDYTCQADVALSLPNMQQPRRFEDVVTHLKCIVAQMLSSTRVQLHGAVSEDLRTRPLIISTDYSGMGTAEFAAIELQVGR